NGLGGYASGPVQGPPARRFHGALIAATERGRMLAVSELRDGLDLPDFALEQGLPVWRSAQVERRVVLPNGRNLAIWSWRALSAISLTVRPSFQVRPHEGRVDAPARAYPVAIDALVCEIFDAEPPHAPRGCIAQAWSVAEVLRCW
ncbi:MAG: glycogen debranching enzyme N-terminal domain-containing protein, partial [Myxococcales bacterium]